MDEFGNLLDRAGVPWGLFERGFDLGIVRLCPSLIMLGVILSLAGEIFIKFASIGPRG